MTIDVKLNKTEKDNLDKAYEVLSHIENTLSYLRDSKNYTYVDHVHLPQEVMNLIAISKRVSAWV